MTINQAPLHTKLIVKSFSSHEVGEFSDVQSRLMHMGFIAGEEVRITRKAPIFKEPLLVEVRGRSVAMTLEEAGLVSVEVYR